MMELQQKKLGGFRAVFDATTRQEETLESIVPDAMPDIKGIIHTSGTVFLRQREAADGSIRMTGSVRTAILYQPEGENTAPCCLTLDIPFLCCCDHPAIAENCPVVADVRVIAADARLLNPRKVLARVEIVARGIAYQEDTCLVSVGVEGDGVPGLQTRMESHPDFVATDVMEKAVTFSDVVRLPGPRLSPGALLSARGWARSPETRVIGTKLVVKGEVSLTVHYLAGDTLTAARLDLPYSQVLELGSEGEEGFAQVDAVLTSLGCEPGGEGELKVEAGILLQAALCRPRRVELLADLYSVSRCMETERGQVTLMEQKARESRRQIVRQQCPWDAPVRMVIDCALEIGEISQTPTAEQGVMLTAKCCVDVLCLLEDDSLVGAAYTIPAELELPLPRESRCVCRCVPAGEVTAVPVSGGIEVRFEVEFCTELYTASTATFAAAAKVLPETNQPDRPSVVVRLVGEGEALWDIAKACGSTVSDICGANLLSDEAVPPGTLLLIPKSR